MGGGVEVGGAIERPVFHENTPPLRSFICHLRSFCFVSKKNG